ncbi:hypothetical protein AVEN_186505-1 [Araneus ventricosus]|uniref:Uncharacterized protein n=1 Tax=Araneus ventricosus TaxID=182803 RepID=A0A4Y2QFI5_ARAVE|nr:hypothetical protein AVEN_186505-1 [Araneus ventricosus]
MDIFFTRLKGHRGILGNKRADFSNQVKFKAIANCLIKRGFPNTNLDEFVIDENDVDKIHDETLIMDEDWDDLRPNVTFILHVNFDTEINILELFKIDEIIESKLCSNKLSGDEVENVEFIPLSLNDAMN